MRMLDPATRCAVVGACLALVALVALAVERVLVLQLPYDVPVLYSPVMALAEGMPRVAASRGVTLFSAREFSRACCAYGPTVYRTSTFLERSFSDFGAGERGIYDFGRARAALEASGERRTSVSVPMTMLAAFLRDFLLPLPADYRVVLVTGQEDCGPAEVFGFGRAECASTMPVSLEGLLADDRLVAWMAQNFDLVGCERVPHMAAVCRDPALPKALLAKVEALPIGLDFHTASEKTTFFKESPAAQEAKMMAAKTVPWARKPLRVLAMFTAERKKPDREIALSALPALASCMLELSGGLRRDRFWEAHSEVAFTLAPQGHGIDTHRVYEALSLDTVPVVRSGPLDALYAQLPVVVVSDWRSSLDCSRLADWKADLQRRFGADPFENPGVQERLHLAFWRSRVERKLKLASAVAP